jgi:large subunit ribosomal protein L6
MEQKDGHLLAVRENDSQAAVHGLARALVNNAVRRPKGWTKDRKSSALATAPR